MSNQDNLPRCHGDHPPTAWEGHGGSLAPRAMSRWWKCPMCGTAALEIAREGGALFLMPPRGQTEITTADLAYLNGPLDILWRARAAEVKAWRDARWFTFVSRMLNRKVASDDDLTDWPLEERRAVYASFEAATIAEYGVSDDRALPQKWMVSPQPAQCPLDWEGRAFIYSRVVNGWGAIDVRACAALEIPPDPRRVATLRYFSEVWDGVLGATSTFLHDRVEEVPNGYYDDTNQSDPWFLFVYNRTVFVVGHRKRVVSIEAKGPKIDATLLAMVAKEDTVTFETDGHDLAKSTRVVVHAWTQAKAVEYLSLLIGAVR